MIETILKLIVLIVSILLVILILVQIPEENVGLSGFATKTSIVGSPSSFQKRLNLVIGFGVVIYLVIALTLNLIFQK